MGWVRVRVSAHWVASAQFDFFFLFVLLTTPLSQVANISRVAHGGSHCGGTLRLHFVFGPNLTLLPSFLYYSILAHTKASDNRPTPSPSALSSDRLNCMTLTLSLSLSRVRVQGLKPSVRYGSRWSQIRKSPLSFSSLFLFFLCNNSW